MAERLDRFDEAVARLETATRRQRRIEAAAVVVVLVLVITFQVINRHTVRHAQESSDRAAAARSAELGRKLDDANARIGQLEGALAAAGLRIPEAVPAAPRSQSPTTTNVPHFSTPGPTATTTTTSPPAPARPSGPPSSQPPPSTTTTTSRPPPTTSTTSCLGTIVLICH